MRFAFVTLSLSRPRPLSLVRSLLPSGQITDSREPHPAQDHALVQEYTHSGEIYELTWHPHGRQLAVCGGTEEVAVVPVLLPPGA